MKKIKKLIVIVAAIIIILSLLGIGLGFGRGAGKGAESVPGNTSVSSQTSGSLSQSENILNDRKIISISVVDNDYSYENKRIALEELTRILAEIEPDFVVEITDDNASLKAYNRLLDALDSLSIPYTE